MSSFKIPPPWQSNYAIPGYVRSEGLQMRAHVTKWAPRGTYDDPDPFDPSWDKSWAVPQYIKDEGYGQGARVSEWAPRGFYVGQKALGDVEPRAMAAALPAPYQRFGVRAASAVMGRVMALPAATRKTALKKIVDRIDGSLWSRTQPLADKLVARGVAPATAVHAALARAMSEGFAREVVAAGKTGKKPSARSIAGLGCYGPRHAMCESGKATVMGALAGLGATFTSTRSGEEMGVTKTSAPTGPQPGDCRTDTRTGAVYIWRTATADVPAHWERARTGEACRTNSSYTSAEPGPSGGITVTTADTSRNTASGTTAGTVVTTGSPTVAPVLEMMKVGPFAFPKDATQATVTWHKKLPPELQSAIRKALVLGQTSWAWGTRDWSAFIDGPPVNVNAQMYQTGYLEGSGRTNVNLDPKAGWMPMFKAKHPVTGEDYGVFFTVVWPYGNRTDYNSPEMTPSLRITWAKVQPPHREWYEKVWDFIASIGATIVDIGQAVIEEVAEIACQLASSTSGVQAGAAVGVAAGAGASVGAAGAKVVQAACYEPPPPEAATTQGESIVPILVVGGVVAGVAYLLTRKKGRSSP